MTDTVSRNRPLVPDTDAAPELGVSPATLRVWRRRGIGPRFVRIGRSIRYRRADIEEYISKRTVETSDVI
jgi:predicted DNA-binding transcriptional regulator AlpA